MDIIKSLEWRYATKKFDDTKYLSEEIIKKLCKAFNLTATSYGLQPIKLIIVKNKALQLKMQPIAMNQSQVATASHILVFCIEQQIDNAFIDNYFKITSQIDENNKNDKYQTVLKERFSKKSSEEINLWATKQAYLALGNLLTVCAVEKIDCCPMEGFISNQMDELLNLNDENLASVLLLPIGIRDKNDESAHKPKIRKPINTIIKTIF